MLSGMEQNQKVNEDRRDRPEDNLTIEGLALVRESGIGEDSFTTTETVAQVRHRLDASADA